MDHVHRTISSRPSNSRLGLKTRDVRPPPPCGATALATGPACATTAHPGAGGEKRALSLDAAAPGV
jgi:hypothetical protein